MTAHGPPEAATKPNSIQSLVPDGNGSYLQQFGKRRIAQVGEKILHAGSAAGKRHAGKKDRGRARRRKIRRCHAGVDGMCGVIGKNHFLAVKDAHIRMA